MSAGRAAGDRSWGQPWQPWQPFSRSLKKKLCVFDFKHTLVIPRVWLKSCPQLPPMEDPHGFK